MGKLSNSEFKVLSAIIRLTMGYHRDTASISLTKLQKLTGLSRQGVINATESLENPPNSLVEKIQEAGKTTEWKLVIDDNELVNSVDQSEPELVNSVDQTSQLSRLATSGLKKTIKKKDLKEKRSSSFQGNDSPTSSEENATVWCTSCGGNEAVDKKDDDKGRCAWCLFVDGWTYYNLRGVPQHKIKAGRRVYTTPTAQKLCQKVMTRWKNENFREQWAYALEYASKMEYLKKATWFKPEYFLRNDENYRKIIGDVLGEGGIFDSFEKQNYPESYERLRRWRADRLGLHVQARPASMQLAGGQSEQAGGKEVLFGYS